MYYTREEKLEILQRFYQSGQTMDRFQEENHLGHCTLSRWMSIFATETNLPPLNTRVMAKIDDMEKRKQKASALDVKHLELEVERLKKELEYEKLKSMAYSTMIDVAEEELHINIRKKAGAKQ